MHGTYSICRDILQSCAHRYFSRYSLYGLRNIQREEMVKEIIRALPDGDFDFDGEEIEDPEFEEMMEEWWFELNTYNF